MSQNSVRALLDDVRRRPGNYRLEGRLLRMIGDTRNSVICDDATLTKVQHMLTKKPSDLADTIFTGKTATRFTALARTVARMEDALEYYRVEPHSPDGGIRAAEALGTDTLQDDTPDVRAGAAPLHWPPTVQPLIDALDNEPAAFERIEGYPSAVLQHRRRSGVQVRVSDRGVEIGAPGEVTVTLQGADAEAIRAAWDRWHKPEAATKRLMQHLGKKRPSDD